MAKNNIATQSEKEWQIENDAWSLIEAEKIKLDPKRLSDAQKKAADIIKKQSEESKKTLQVAKKFNNKSPKKAKK